MYNIMREHESEGRSSDVWKDSGSWRNSFPNGIYRFNQGWFIPEHYTSAKGRGLILSVEGGPSRRRDCSVSSKIHTLNPEIRTLFSGEKGCTYLIWPEPYRKPKTRSGVFLTHNTHPLSLSLRPTHTRFINKGRLLIFYGVSALRVLRRPANKQQSTTTTITLNHLNIQKRRTLKRSPCLGYSVASLLWTVAILLTHLHNEVAASPQQLLTIVVRFWADSYPISSHLKCRPFPSAVMGPRYKWPEVPVFIFRYLIFPVRGDKNWRSVPAGP